MQTTQSPKAGERTQPNKTLPPGANMLTEPIKKKVGGYVELEYDAAGDYFGVTWLRVKGGLGERNDREDWIADMPAGAGGISVHDYHWNGEDFGMNHGSFLGAIQAETKLSLSYEQRNEQETLKKLDQIRESIRIMRASIATMPGPRFYPSRRRSERTGVEFVLQGPKSEIGTEEAT